MSSAARVLSTAELGAIRYAQADDAQKFPVEFKYKNGSSTSRQQQHPAAATAARGGGAAARSGQDDVVVVTVAGSAADATADDGAPESAVLKRNPHGGEWSAVMSVAPGPLTYAISRNGIEVAAGGLEVTPPEAPFGNTKLASKLTTRVPSGAKQKKMQDPAKALMRSDGQPLWDVEFIYAEEMWSVAEVWVEVVGRDPVQMKPTFGQESFSVTVPLSAGTARFRFRVHLREPCRPDVAPFTRLGWDAAACTSGGLSTWELSIDVNDLRNGRPAGAAVMRHEKKSKDLLVSLKENKVPGDTIVSGVSVKSAAAKIDTAPSEGSGRGSDSSARVHEPTGDTSEGSTARVTTSAKPSGGNGDDESVDDAQGPTGDPNPANLRGGGLWLAVVPVIGIGLVAILAALVGRGNNQPHAVVDDDGARSNDCRQSSKFGYMRHATSQGL